VGAGISYVIHSGGSLKGRTNVPGDKSVSHRAILLGALAEGTSYLPGWLKAEHTKASLKAIQTLGVPVKWSYDRIFKDEILTITGGTLIPPKQHLYLGRTATGLRLLAGILSGQQFASVLDGEPQLRNRPMGRILEPLQKMGANIKGSNGYPPLYIQPSSLKGISYSMKIPSAQVKSAILLAGLFAKGTTVVTQPSPCRDHTERMLQAMGADIEIEHNTIVLRPGKSLSPLHIKIPGDFSSAAFLIIAALLLPESDIIVEGVNLNPTRTGLLEVLYEMKADISVVPSTYVGGEYVGEIQVRHSQLKGVHIKGEMVGRMIDEFPALMVASLFAEGETLVQGAEELRVKESDRISAMVKEIEKLGGKIQEFRDGFCIKGPQQLKGTVLTPPPDHRTVMSLTVAGLKAKGSTIIKGAECTEDSFPSFPQILKKLGIEIEIIKNEEK